MDVEPAPPRPRNDVVARIGRRLPYRWAAPALLVVMSITFAELLTGSTPFLALLLNPLSLLFLVGLYGGGVLAIREFSVRIGARWPAVLLLGAAYGILEEGFATRTFFDPSVVGYLGVYGHWAGVNWVWAVQLMIFHAIFSIALPIFLLGVAAPSTRGRPLLSRRGGFIALAAALSTTLVMFFLFDPGYRAPGLPVLLFGLLALALVGVARSRRVRSWVPAVPSGPARPRRLVTIGAVGVSSFFALNWVGPFLIPAPAVLILVMLAAGLALAYAGWAEFQRMPADQSTVLLAAGLLSFLLLLALGLELVGDWGVGLAAAGTMVLLYTLHTRSRPDDMGGVPPPAVGASLGG